MKKVVILSAGPGLNEIVVKYGHSSDWIPALLSDYKLNFLVKKTYLNDSLSLDDGDLFIITGSKYSVYDRNEWIIKLLDFVTLLIKPQIELFINFYYCFTASIMRIIIIIIIL